MPFGYGAGEAFTGRTGGFSGNGTTGTALATGGLSMLFGGATGPTEEERRRLYAQQTGALRGSIGQAQQDAQRAAMSAATTATGGGNPFLAGRLGSQAAGDAAQRIASQGVAQQQQLTAQQTAMEMQQRQQQAQATQQRIGGLLGAGGQVLGMAVPAFGALRGAAGATGLAGALGGSGNPVGGVLGSALGGGSQPMPQGSTLLGPGGMGIPQTSQPPGPAPAGMRWDPMTNQWVPQDSASYSLTTR